MTTPTPAVLVFCDLDNTLFEPHTFCLDPSTSRAFDRLEHRQLPLVLCSTKTRAELELMQRELGLRQPFICEDGGALFVPRGYFGPALPHATDVAGYQALEFGRHYPEIVDALHGIAEHVGTEVMGFDDMSVDQVATDSGVPLMQARLAKLREYSEAFRIVDPAPAAGVRLLKAVRGAGYEWTTRGRYHFIRARHRNRARQTLRGLYRKLLGPFVSIAVSDDPDNVEFLQEADIPLVVHPSMSAAWQQTAAYAAVVQASTARTVGACAQFILSVADAVQTERPVS
jgi:mannosyl-3-phosphoglycerate phosphatase